MPQAGLLQHIEPDFQASPGELIERSRRLADRPEHAEIANGGSLCAVMALENHHAQTTPGEVVGVGQPQDASAHHGDVVGLCHPTPLLDSADSRQAR